MKLLLLVLCLASTNSAFAQESTAQNYNDFYTVSESQKSALTDMSPAQALEDVLGSESLTALKAQVYDLLNLQHHNENFGSPTEKYSRLEHFGTWIHEKNDNSCYNTRAKILIRDSSVKPEFGGNGCTVTRGQWLDPYTDGKYTRATDMQIDHVVPLKNAYENGAWKWNYNKRCLYANFRGNDFHLLAVLGHENMKKGDKGPEGYMPPSSSYTCEYLQNWLKIKLIWQLHLTDDEAQAVSQLVQENHCDKRDFKMNARDLTSQRNFMTNNANLCN